MEPQPSQNPLNEALARALTRRMHRLLDDAELDRLAVRAGCPSGIGRLCALSDALAQRVFEASGVRGARAVLDLGCGRGFVGRLLAFAGAAATYTGVDREAAALAAARRQLPQARLLEADARSTRWNREFDAVFAVEMTSATRFDDTLARVIASALVPGGCFALTVASSSAEFSTALERACAIARAHVDEVRVADATPDAAAFLSRYFTQWLASSAWDERLREPLQREARAVLDAIARKVFAYAIVTGVGR